LQLRNLVKLRQHLVPGNESQVKVDSGWLYLLLLKKRSYYKLGNYFF